MKFKEVTLYTSQIELQNTFYTEVLGLKNITDTKNIISFKVRNTHIKFVKCNSSHPYHFAFNIPSNKTNEALEWLKKRVEIQKDGQAEIVDFPAWNAKSIYFYDADKNILEFIARKNLVNKTVQPFSAEALLEISEIGIATNQFKEKFTHLTSELGLRKFGGGEAIFSAIGSERGLFILIDKLQKDWFPTNDKAFSADFQTIFEVEQKTIRLTFKNDTITYEYL
ncbi:VOC family protein [Aequorivita flava]|uniref:VOC family protein n=1 Tax=Aequorivita flava TaxID=3114371 RepID=A0AB35YRL8_9FLAO